MRRCLSAVVLAAVVALVGCSGDAADPARTTGDSTSVRSDAPELDEIGSYYNFISESADGLTVVLAGVRTAYTDEWVGLADDPLGPTALDPGDYDVVAMLSASCPGVGEEVDEDSAAGVVGIITVPEQGSAGVQSTPVELDPDTLAGLVLTDAEGTIIACSKRVDWTPPAKHE